MHVHVGASTLFILPGKLHAVIGIRINITLIGVVCYQTAISYHCVRKPVFRFHKRQFSGFIVQDEDLPGLDNGL